MSAAGSRLAAIQVLFVLLWSSGFVSSKSSLDYAGPFTFLFYRYFIATCALLALLLVRNELRVSGGTSLRRLILTGVLGHALYLSTMTMAFALGAGAATAALICSLQPIVVAALSSRGVGERTASHQWIGVGVAFCAIVVMLGDDSAANTSSIACLLLFMSLACLSIATVHQRWVQVEAGSEPPALLHNLAVQCVASMLALGFLALIVEDFEANWSLGFVVNLTWLALFVTLGGFGLMCYLVQRCTATCVSSLTFCSIPVTMVLSYLMFGDAMSMVDTVCVTVVLAGVVLVQCPQAVASLGQRRLAHLLRSTHGSSYWIRPLEPSRSTISTSPLVPLTYSRASL